MVLAARADPGNQREGVRAGYVRGASRGGCGRGCGCASGGRWSAGEATAQ
jgi:hypothetical protein